jgi:hypothetical protein
MEQAAHSVFISYARADSDWVTIAVNLLRAGGAKVFMDIRDLAYGDRWEEVLVSKLHEVERVMVFWSRHAADSEWVNREWQLALNNGKRLVPVPIDDTPLPDDLSQYQALTDLMPLLRQSAPVAPAPAPAAAPVHDRAVPRASSGVWLRALGMAAAIVVPVAVLALIAIPQFPAPLPTEGPPTQPPVYAQEAAILWPWIVGAAVFIALIVWLGIRWKRQRRQGKLPEDTVEPDSSPVAAGEPTHVSRPPEALGRRVVDMVFSDPDRVDAG